MIGHNELPATPKEIRETLRAFERYTREVGVAPPPGLTHEDVCWVQGLRDGLIGATGDPGPDESPHYQVGYRAALALRKGGTPWL